MSDASTAPLRVVLCDDAVGFPELVAFWLAAAGVELVAHAASEAELLEILPASRADVVLLDFMLPEGGTDLRRLEQIREAAPGARVVLVSSLPSLELEHVAERLGVDGWCPKATTQPELLSAITGGTARRPQRVG